jgi:hypothetical protein
VGKPEAYGQPERGRASGQQVHQALMRLARLSSTAGCAGVADE